MRQAVSLKVVYDDGLIEDIKSAIVIAEDENGLSYEAMNILPDKQMLLVAIAFHSMLKEMMGDEIEEWSVEREVLNFIRQLMNPIDINQTKGDVLQ